MFPTDYIYGSSQSYNFRQIYIPYPMHANF
jgi:hypothetical protein